MRLFNDTMSALALNAYEINDIQNTISEQLQIRNTKLDKMEKSAINVEQSLTNMEKLISRMMETI